MTTPDHNIFFAAHIADDQVVLDPDETRHLFAVMRAKPDEPLLVTDGRGAIYTCKLLAYDRSGARASIISKKTGTPPHPALALLVGLPDKDAFGAVIDGVVPVGVRRIVPVVCKHCQEKWWQGAWEKQAERFRGKMIADVKQSLNPFLPELFAPVSFERCLHLVSGLSLVAEESGKPLAEMESGIRAAATVSCFVGPPGGFAEEELAALKGAGAVAVRLSQNRLRTELAATVLCSAIMQAGM